MINHRTISVVVALVGMFLMPHAHGAPDIYVTTSGGGDGSSWAQPTTLPNALATASASDVIWMKAGTYTHTSTFAVSTTGLEIYGGFAGTETNVSQRDLANNVVLLNGQNTRCVVNIQADDVLLDGLVITNGMESATHAAGVRVDGSQNLTMRNCSVVENTMTFNSGYGAGAYFNNAGPVLLSNCIFRANEATSRGHGCGFLVQGTTTLTVMDCDIRENHDSGGDQRLGKGFYLKSGTLVMVGTTVADNTFDSDDNDGRGGGGYIEGGSAVFSNCVFTGNHVWHSDGGGLYIASGNVTIENCTFVGNGGLTDNGNAEGGAIFMNGGTVNIKNSIFWDNQAGNDANDGDTIYQVSGTLNISYTCMDGTELPRVRFVKGTWGDGIITDNPLFAANYTDLHLRSTVGRWNGATWVTDGSDSPCIDSGDPTSAYGNETASAHGARVNMGAYGNTWQASQSANVAPTVDTQPERVVANAAELNGVLSAGASSSIIFYYGLGNGLENPANWDATNILSDLQLSGDTFSSVAGGLQEGQTYWFTVYATNAFGQNWGTPRSFATGTAASGGGAGVIHVDANAVGVPEGRSWTNAFTAFEDALAAADAGLGSNIWVAEGSYLANEPYVIQTDGISVYGGFLGNETNLTERDWSANDALLDGGRKRRLIEIQADDVLLDGLVVTNGLQAGANAEYGVGLIMRNGPQNITLLNCRFVDNRAGPEGYGGSGHGIGAYFKDAGTVLISNCVFGANQCSQRGQGIGFRSDGSATVTVLDSEIRDNYDSGGDQRAGKGFVMSGGSLVMVRTDVTGNYYDSDDSRRPGPGGGGYISVSSAAFTNCVFMRNDSDRSDGSGLYINSGDVTMESCTFAGNGTIVNREESRGGAIYQKSGTVSIHNSIFWGNEAGAGAMGDQIYQEGGTMSITYACLEGTTSPHLMGGAITLTTGIITNDPLFAVEFTDAHLKSKAGRWNGSRWTKDKVFSPCIDAGDPSSDYSREPDGKAINLGAYGNTPEASRISMLGTVLLIQ